jgi:hypothetical protein
VVIRLSSKLVGGDGVVDVRDIDVMRARLGAAGNLADILAVGWDAFDLVQAVADSCADRSPGMFAAFLFAAVSAVEGRDACGFAPSIPAGPGMPAEQAGPGPGDVDEVAGVLGGLVAVLGSKLQAAAGQADDPGDRRACEHAVQQAGQIRDLLVPGS